MTRHSRMIIFIHWATALLVLAAWFTAAGGPEARANPPVLHFTLGIAVLLLMVPRLLSRWLASPPASRRAQRGVAELAAKAGHAVLYLFLIGLPLTGWYAASRMGITVSFLGLELPSIAAAVEGKPGLIAELHERGGTLILVLAGLHALVAMWHQWVRRDGTLGRMLPLPAAQPTKEF